MLPKIPLSEVQTLWLKELGVAMLWGQALTPYTPETDVQQIAVNKTSTTGDVSVPVMPSSEQHPSVDNSIALIKRSSPEGKTKSGRVSREQEQAIQEIHQNLQRHQTRQRRSALPGIPAIPIVKAQTWMELDAEIRHQYMQWKWVSDEKEVLIGQTGKPSPDLLIIEEMPGADDYVEGEVFSGDTGVLLANMLAPLGIVKDDVAITSLLKVHLREDTTPNQYLQSLPYLQAQIQMLKPKCIWLLGARAAQPFLQQENGRMDILRGQEWFYPLTDEMNIPVVVSHHPSLLLINQNLKADIWQDLQKIHAYLKT